MRSAFADDVPTSTFDGNGENYGGLTDQECDDMEQFMSEADDWENPPHLDNGEDTEGTPMDME